MKKTKSKRLKGLGAFPFKPKAGARELRAEQPVRVPRRTEINYLPSFDYSTKSAPCNTNRKGCPVQLRYERGQAVLVMCGSKKREVVGRVQVKDAVEANRIAREACECWSRTKSLSECRASIRNLTGLKRRKKAATKKRSRR